MTGQVPHPVKRERMERLVELVQRRARERAQRFVGRSMEVLVEGPSRTDPPAPRPHPPQQDGQLRGHGRARRAGRGGDHRGHVDHALGARETAQQSPLKVLAIFGPTGVGKTAVAIATADRLRERGEDPVAVSCDALQVYRGLETLSGPRRPRNGLGSSTGWSASST